MQLRRLEGLVGSNLLHRNGRGVRPTADGELFLGYALRILALSEEAHARLHPPELEGIVRIGMPEEVALAALPSALGQFRRAHPQVRLDVQVNTTVALASLWQAGALDLMVGAVSAMSDEAKAVWSVALHWVSSTNYERDPGRPLDLVIFAEPCTWRARLLEAADASGHPWRIAFTSPSMAAVQAAVENGLGITLLAPECIRHPAMRILEESTLPDPPIVQYGLFTTANQTPVTQAAMNTLLKSVGQVASAT